NTDVFLDSKHVHRPYLSHCSRCLGDSILYLPKGEIGGGVPHFSPTLIDLASKGCFARSQCSSLHPNPFGGEIELKDLLLRFTDGIRYLAVAGTELFEFP